MAEVSVPVIKCSFCIRDLSKVTRVACAECTAVLCVKCFQYGSEAGDHKRGHNYEIIDCEEKDTLFNRQWGREDEQNLIQTVHRYKLGNWEEVSQVISKGGRKRVVADVSRHFQLYFVQSTLGRTAMKEKEWIERRDAFKDDITRVISDPSGRELYYHAVVEALRATKDLPDINDNDIVNKIDQIVRDYFASLNRAERKRKASELGAVLSKSRATVRKEVFPYGESDDDAWWEKMFKEPREKKEVDRYYEENSVCTEEKCMAEAVEPDDMVEILRMMKDAGLEDHEELGDEIKALKMETLSLEPSNALEKRVEWGTTSKDAYAFKSRLDRPEPESKRAKMELLEASNRPHLAVDLKQEVLMEAVIDDEEVLKQLEGKDFFEAKLQMCNDQDESDADLETSCDEADAVEDNQEQETSEESSATDSDSDASIAVFDYEAYEAKMRAAGYATDELYSDWDEESKEEMAAKLRELAQRGALADSSEEADDEEEEEGEENSENQEESVADTADSSMEDDDVPCGSSGVRKPSLDLCGLESEASEDDDEEEQEEEEDDNVESAASSEELSSDNGEDESADDCATTSSSSPAISDCESEAERLDTLFGAPAMRVPKTMLKDKKKNRRTVKFYELGSDDEYHTMDEDTAALPMAEMSVGESRRRSIARQLRAKADKYYDRDPETGRYTVKTPRPSMSPDLAASIEQYTRWEFDRMLRAGEVTPPPCDYRVAAAAALPAVEADEDRDKTPEARFGDDFESGKQPGASSSSDPNCGPVHADHPAFQKYIMERFMGDSDDGSDCESEGCESISSEVGEQLMQELGYPIAGEKQGDEEGDIYEDAEEVQEGENEDIDGEEEQEQFVDAKEEPMEEGEERPGANGTLVPKLEVASAPESKDKIAAQLRGSFDNVMPPDASKKPSDVVEREIKQEEPEEQEQAQAQPPADVKPIIADTRAKTPKQEPADDYEQQKQKKSTEHAEEQPAKERKVTVKREKSAEAPTDGAQQAGEDQMEEEDSEGTRYMLAEEHAEGDGENEEGEGQDEEEEENGDDFNDDELHGDFCDCRNCKYDRGEKLDEDECEDDEDFEAVEGEEDEEDNFECVREIEGVGMRCVCTACTKNRWTETLGEKEHALWAKIKRAGLSFEEVKDKLRRHFVDDDSESDDESSHCEASFYDNDDEPEEVYVDAVKVNDHEWRLNLNSPISPIPVSRASGRSEVIDSSDNEPLSPPPAAVEEEETVDAPVDEEEKMEVDDESVDRPTSSSKTESSAILNEASLCGLEDEKEEDEEEEEEEDKDKTPPMLAGDDERKGEDGSAPDDVPRTPVLVIKKIHARGRTNLRVETRPRTPQDEKKAEDKDAEAMPAPAPPKKKKISKEFELLFKDLEIRKWEESQAKTLKERATKAMGTGREKFTRCGTAIAVSDSETEQDPRKKKGRRDSLDDLPSTSNKDISLSETPPPEDELPRTTRRDQKPTKDSKRKSSGSPKKGKKDDKKKGKKRAAEPEESEKEQSSGEEEDEEEEETNGGDTKSPSKKRRKNKRVSMSKKERKAKWDKKIQNRRAREEKRVEEKKKVVSSIEFFEQHEVTFFANVFRRIPFDYEDHGFRNRVNFKSWINEIYNMGYNQDRDDFEFEYYNDAEQIVSRLNIMNNEGGMPLDMETEIKLAKVDRYLRVLQERRALRNRAAEYETIPDFLQLCRRMNSERRKLKDIIKSKPADEKFDNKLTSVLARDELLEMKLAKSRLLKIRSRTDKLKELHAAGTTTLEGHESVARFKPRTKFGRSEEQKKVDERERGTLLEFDEQIASRLERLSLVAGHSGDEDTEPSALAV